MRGLSFQTVLVAAALAGGIATPARPATAATACAVSYTVPATWPGAFFSNITIYNTGTTTIDGWNLNFTFSGNQTVTYAINATFTQSGQNVSLVNKSYNARIPIGGSTSLSFQATFSGTNAEPTAFSVNGISCTVLP